MTVWVLVLVIICLLAINIFLWKSGFLGQAESPRLVSDLPTQEPKERKAFLKRLLRWREHGKVSREEYEHLSRLTEEDWDLPP